MTEFLDAYLQASDTVDFQHPEVASLARSIAAPHKTQEAIAKACFEWVRDEIRHSYDYQANPVTNFSITCPTLHQKQQKSMG